MSTIARPVLASERISRSQGAFRTSRKELFKDEYPITGAIVKAAVKHIGHISRRPEWELSVNPKFSWTIRAKDLGLKKSDFENPDLDPVSQKNCPPLNKRGERHLMWCIGLAQKNLDGQSDPQLEIAKTQLDQYAKTARELLYEASLPMACNIAQKRYFEEGKREGLSLYDFQEIAKAGLKLAVDTNNYNIYKDYRLMKGLRLSTWAYKVINWHISDVLYPPGSQGEWLVKYDDPYLNEVFHLKTQAWKMRSYRDPNSEYLLGAINKKLIEKFPELKSDRVRLANLAQMVIHRTSFPRAYIGNTRDDIDTCGGTKVQDLFEPPESAYVLDFDSDKEFLRKTIESDFPVIQGQEIKNPLEPLERQIVLEHFGKKGTKPLPLIAHRLKMLPDEIAKILESALTKLKNWDELKAAFGFDK